MTVISPGGSNFPYYYKGGEIHCMKYGSFFTDEQRLFQVMDAEEVFIKQRPNRKLRVWVDFYETTLSPGVLFKFAEQIFNIRSQIVKLAVVGCSAADKRKLNKAMKTHGAEFSIPCTYFDDPEEAKTWLVT
jgi:hypothetical protein